MALIQTVHDQFSSKDLTKWQSVGGGDWPSGVYISSGQLWIDATTDYANEIESIASYDLTESSVAIQIMGLPTQGGDGSTEMYFTVSETASTSDRIYYIISGSTFLNCYMDTGGVTRFSDGLPYSSTNHAWLRFRHSASTIYYEASPNGITWTTLFSPAQHADLNVTAMTIRFRAGTYGTVTPVGTAKYDNLNMMPNRFFAFF